MRHIKLFFLISLGLFLSSALFIVINTLTSNAVIPFVYGLKTKPAHKIVYLPESNSSILEANAQTVGIYSTKKEHFFLKEIFQISGVPYLFSDHLKELNQTKIIFLDFNINTPKTLTEYENKFLHDFVKHGGILIGNEVLPTRNGALKDLFGYKSYTVSSTHHALHLLHSTYYTYLDTAEEKHYTLSTISKAPYTNIIQTGTAIPIAVYDDNSTAITLNHYGKGIAINLGISLFDLRYRNLFNKDFHANTKYINDFEPLSDFIILFIKGIYQKSFRSSLMLHTSKNGNQATVIMTHDVDFDNSIKNIPKFTALEEKLGFRATYNIQVKYITDYKDRAFFQPKNLMYIQNAEKNGHEIGAHTILHTKNFFLLPKGNCNESYPEYKPFSVSQLKDKGNPTVCGEIKVAKELLLGANVKQIMTFRAGELLYNPNLPDILEKFGYKYSSCFSAENVLSYFPYRYAKDYKTLSAQSKIWEIPLVLEDEFFPPMYFRLDNALTLFKKIYDNGAVYTILDHPDLTLYKLKNLDLRFIENFYQKLPKDVWKVTTKEFGDYWDKRDRIIFRYNIVNNQLILTIHSLSDIQGVTFTLNNIHIQPAKNSKLIHNKLVINIKKGYTKWVFRIE